MSTYKVVHSQWMKKIQKVKTQDFLNESWRLLSSVVGGSYVEELVVHKYCGCFSRRILVGVLEGL
jgi:hypothetical protein